LPANEKVGPGDRFIAARLVPARTIAVATKSDLVGPERLATHLLDIAALGEWAEIIPVSAATGDQLDILIKLLVDRMPEGPLLYPDGEPTDEPLDVRVAELIREAALDGVREELPHSLAVLVEEIVPREGGPTLVRADVYVERDSQKAIVIGAKGARLRDVGIRARTEIEALLGTRVYLDLHVRVAKDWQRDPKYLRRLGF